MENVEPVIVTVVAAVVPNAGTAPGNENAFPLTAAALAAVSGTDRFDATGLPGWLLFPPLHATSVVTAIMTSAAHLNFELII